MTGPAVPPGGEELRSALMKWLSARVGGMCWDEAPWQEWGDEADELLALPEMRAVLAAQETLADDRNPKVCPRCGNWCVYDGWDHVHGSGLGIGSCSGDRETDRGGEGFP